MTAGGTPKSHGVYYDVSYDRTLYAVGDVNCTGPAGTVVAYDDSITDATLLAIDATLLPNELKDGVCSPAYPHSHPRVNNIFTVRCPGDSTVQSKRASCLHHVAGSVLHNGGMSTSERAVHVGLSIGARPLRRSHRKNLLCMPCTCCWVQVISDVGGDTYWSDKHPAYDVVQGSAGDGVKGFCASFR
jgi:hypothetical protein